MDKPYAKFLCKMNGILNHKKTGIMHLHLTAQPFIAFNLSSRPYSLFVQFLLCIFIQMTNYAAIESGIEMIDENEYSETSTIGNSYQKQSYGTDKSLVDYSPLPLKDSDGWARALVEGSLSEYNGLIDVNISPDAPWYKKLWAYVGPGALIAVGYMDPGNWSTDIAGGSAYGYKLLFVVLLSTLMGMFLQILALRVGLATRRDLAQACRDAYPKPLVYVLWVIIEIAICATDVAEVIGSAVAMKILFGLPLIYGVLITAGDVLLVLFLNGNRFRYIELLVVILVLIITASFAAQLIMSQPNGAEVLQGFLPSEDLFKDKGMLFVAVGIIGATVMPHNLYLHSSIVLTRNIPRDDESVKKAMWYGTIDSTASLCLALFVNAAILMVAAATFHNRGYDTIATLEDASRLLAPLLNNKWAPVLFGVALLASGQNSTLTGTLSGQIVMEGFVDLKISPVFRRIGTRVIAIVPAVIAIAIGGDESANNLLILSQVVLSFALPFAVLPLVHISSSEKYMGVHANSTFSTVCAVVISVVCIVLNLVLVIPM